MLCHSSRAGRPLRWERLTTGPAPSTNRYPPSAIALHWLMLSPIVAVYAAILLRENLPRGSDIREAFKAWHFTLGLSVPVLVVARLALRLTL